MLEIYKKKNLNFNKTFKISKIFKVCFYKLSNIILKNIKTRK